MSLNSQCSCLVVADENNLFFIRKDFQHNKNTDKYKHHNKTKTSKKAQSVGVLSQRAKSSYIQRGGAVGTLEKFVLLLVYKMKNGPICDGFKIVIDVSTFGYNIYFTLVHIFCNILC